MISWSIITIETHVCWCGESWSAFVLAQRTCRSRWRRCDRCGRRWSSRCWSPRSAQPSWALVLHRCWRWEAIETTRACWLDATMPSTDLQKEKEMESVGRRYSANTTAYTKVFITLSHEQKLNALHGLVVCVRDDCWRDWNVAMSERIDWIDDEKRKPGVLYLSQDRSLREPCFDDLQKPRGDRRVFRFQDIWWNSVVVFFFFFFHLVRMCVL